MLRPLTCFAPCPSLCSNNFPKSSPTDASKPHASSKASKPAGAYACTRTKWCYPPGTVPCSIRSPNKPARPCTPPCKHGWQRTRTGLDEPPDLRQQPASHDRATQGINLIKEMLGHTNLLFHPTPFSSSPIPTTLDLNESSKSLIRCENLKMIANYYF